MSIAQALQSGIYRFASRRARARAVLSLIERGRWEIAERVIRWGVDLRLKSAAGDTVFSAVLRQGSLACMRALIFQGADLDQPVRGEAPLIQAWYSPVEGREKAEALVVAGAHVNAKSGVGDWTLLGFAAFSGDEALALFLLEKGADPERRSRSGLSPVLLARIAGKDGLARLLVSRGAQDEQPALRDIEPNFISGSSIFSQVHETVKTGIRFAHCVLARVTVDLDPKAPRAEASFCYRVPVQGRDRIIEVTFLATGGIQAVLLDSSEGRVLRDFLDAASGGISLRDLRARIQAVLEELAKGGDEEEKERREQQESAPPLELSPQVRSACALLGIAPGSSMNEVVRAYRRLAKEHHPDAAPQASDALQRERVKRMAQINLAYDTIKKSRL